MAATTKTFEYPYPKAMEYFPSLRQSTLSTFDNCGLAAAFEMEWRRGWNTGPQGRGTIFHRVAAECLREMFRMREDSIPVDAAHAILGDVLRQDDADRVCPQCGTEKIKPGVNDNGQRTCSAGHKFATQLVNVSTEQIRELYWVVTKWAHESVFDIGLLVDVEQRLSAALSYPNRLSGGMVPRLLTGQIDVLLIDETATHATVIDWKDTFGMPAGRGDDEDDDVSFKGYFQQRFYAWLIFKNYPSIQKVTLRERYVRYGESREATVSRKLEEEIERELAALAERFDRAFNTRPASVVPTPGKHCNFCLRPASCPILPDAREEGMIVTEKDAVRLAWEIIVSEEIAKRNRKAASAYAELNGPIPVKAAKGMRALGYVAETRTKRPDIEQIRRAEMAKGSPLTTDELAKLYRTKTGTRFKFYTPVEVDEAASNEEIEEKLKQSIEAAREAQKQKLAEAEAAGEPLKGKRHLHVVQDKEATG